MTILQRSAPILLAIVLAACGTGQPTTPASTRTSENFATSAPSAEPSPTATIAPTETPLAPPEFTGGVEPGLTAQNMVGGKILESGKWVTKNANGITAEWDEVNKKWIYNAENLINTDYVVPPISWTSENNAQEGLRQVTWTANLAAKLRPLTSAELIPNPDVPDGEFNTCTTVDSGGHTATYHEFGASVGDITLVRPTDKIIPANQYVVQIQIINPNFPDRRYLLDFALNDDGKGWRSGMAFDPAFPSDPQYGAMFWVRKPGQEDGVVQGKDFVLALQKLRGQKVIIDIPSDTVSDNSQFVEQVRNSAQMIAAINRGLPLPDLPYTPRAYWIRLPRASFP